MECSPDCIPESILECVGTVYTRSKSFNILVKCSISINNLVKCFPSFVPFVPFIHSSHSPPFFTLFHRSPILSGFNSPFNHHFTALNRHHSPPAPFPTLLTSFSRSPAHTRKHDPHIPFYTTLYHSIYCLFSIIPHPFLTMYFSSIFHPDIFYQIAYDRQSTLCLYKPTSQL